MTAPEAPPHPEATEPEVLNSGLPDLLHGDNDAIGDDDAIGAGDRHLLRAL